MAKNCPKCNAEISDSAKFCPKCGAAIPQQPEYDETPEPNNKPRWILAIILAALLLIVVGVTMYSDYAEQQKERLAQQQKEEAMLEAARQDSIKKAEMREKHLQDSIKEAKIRADLDFERFLNMLNNTANKQLAEMCGFEKCAITPDYVYEDTIYHFYLDEAGFFYGRNVAVDYSLSNGIIFRATADHARYFLGKEIGFKDKEDFSAFTKKAKDYAVQNNLGTIETYDDYDDGYRSAKHYLYPGDWYYYRMEKRRGWYVILFEHI